MVKWVTKRPKYRPTASFLVWHLDDPHGVPPKCVKSHTDIEESSCKISWWLVTQLARNPLPDKQTLTAYYALAYYDIAQLTTEELSLQSIITITIMAPSVTGWAALVKLCLFVWLVFNGTFSTTRLYHATGESALRQLWRDDHDEDEQLKQWKRN